MELSEYHKKYADYSDDEISRRILVKEKELEQILDKTVYRLEYDPVRIAVLGCGDRRLVQAHREMYERLFGREIELVTFDITTEHLIGEEGVVRHDVTKPLPSSPYDVIVGHVLMPFIELSKKWDVLWNAYQALRNPGIAIHIVGLEEGLDTWRERFVEKEIRVEVLPLVVEGVLSNPLKSQALIIQK